MDLFKYCFKYKNARMPAPKTMASESKKQQVPTTTVAIVGFLLILICLLTSNTIIQDTIIFKFYV